MSTTCIDRQAVATAIATALTALLSGVKCWDKAQGFPYGSRTDETLPALIVEVSGGAIEEIYSGGFWGSDNTGGNLYTIHYLQALPSEVAATVEASVSTLHANLTLIKAALLKQTTSTLTDQIQRITRIDEQYDGDHNVVNQYLGTFLGARLVVHLVELNYLAS